MTRLADLLARAIVAAAWSPTAEAVGARLGWERYGRAAR